MFETLNQYSFVIAVPVFLVAMFALLPIRRWRVRIPLYTGVAVAALVVFLSLRPGDSSVASTKEVERLLAGGQPVFVEFFSNTCSLCLASEPAVRSLKGEIEDDDVVFMKLNVQDPVAAPFMREFRATITPTFIVFNDLGQEVWRQSANILNKGAALEALGVDSG